MKIYQVSLNCYNMDEMKTFYTEDLGMKLQTETDSFFSVMAGTTKIIFEKDVIQPNYHLCFRTNAAFYDLMFEKLAEKNILLPDENGNFRLFWQGKQAYFKDPDGNILEMLERPFQWSQQNEPTGWFDVGEVGMPVANIQEMQKILAATVEDRQKADDDRFAFYGDQEGVFVLVKEGRNWYPTEIPASIHPIHLVVSGKKETQISHPDFPYKWIVRKEWNEQFPAVQFRIARPTNQIEKMIEFYQNGLGLKKISEFYGHEGYDGVMFGAPDNRYHLEFTQSEEPIELPAPTKEHLLVFYIPNLYQLNQIVHKLAEMGFFPVEPENPYWGRGGVTIEDPDGWRIVLMNTVGIGSTG